MATLATCSRCSRMWSSIVRPRSAAAHPRGASRGPRPPARTQPAPERRGQAAGGDQELDAGRAGTDKVGGPPSREGGRGRRAGGGRGRQRWRSSGARRPARRAAGVRCNKQLATQTPARWACAAAAGRVGTCSPAAGAPAAADVRGPGRRARGRPGAGESAGAGGGRRGGWKMLERGSPHARGEAEGRNGGLWSRPGPECKLCPSELGTWRFWVQSEWPPEFPLLRRPESGRGEIWRNR